MGRQNEEKPREWIVSKNTSMPTLEALEEAFELVAILLFTTWSRYETTAEFRRTTRQRTMNVQRVDTF